MLVGGLCCLGKIQASCLHQSLRWAKLIVLCNNFKQETSKQTCKDTAALEGYAAQTLFHKLTFPWCLCCTTVKALLLLCKYFCMFTAFKTSWTVEQYLTVLLCIYFNKHQLCAIISLSRLQELKDRYYVFHCDSFLIYSLIMPCSVPHMITSLITQWISQSFLHIITKTRDHMKMPQ